MAMNNPKRTIANNNTVHTNGNAKIASQIVKSNQLISYC